jgi:hypothetical protein
LLSGITSVDAAGGLGDWVHRLYSRATGTGGVGST